MSNTYQHLLRLSAERYQNLTSGDSVHVRFKILVRGVPIIAEG